MKKFIKPFILILTLFFTHAIYASDNSIKVISNDVEQEVIEFLFDNLDIVYGRLKFRLLEDEINIKNTQIGTPFEQYIEDKKKYIFPILSQNKIVWAVEVSGDSGDYTLGMTNIYNELLLPSEDNYEFLEIDNNIFVKHGEEIIEFYNSNNETNNKKLENKIEKYSMETIHNKNEKYLSYNELEICNSIYDLCDFENDNIMTYNFTYDYDWLILNCRTIKQTKPDTCWAAAMASIIYFHGGQLYSSKELCEKVHGYCGSRCRGGSLDDLEKALYIAGWRRTLWYEDPSIYDIKTQIYNSNPIYAKLEDNYGNNHGIVISGFSQHCRNYLDCWVEVIDNAYNKNGKFDCQINARTESFRHNGAWCQYIVLIEL